MSRSEPPRADSIRREMAQIRSDIHENVEEIVGTAKSMTDWRYYVRRHPWLALTAAAAVGYLIVPRRSTAARKAAVSSASSSPRAEQPAGLARSLLTLAADALARQAVAYVGREAPHWIAAARAAANPPDPVE